MRVEIYKEDYAIKVKVGDMFIKNFKTENQAKLYSMRLKTIFRKVNNLILVPCGIEEPKNGDIGIEFYSEYQGAYYLIQENVEKTENNPKGLKKVVVNGVENAIAYANSLQSKNVFLLP